MIIPVVIQVWPRPHGPAVWPSWWSRRQDVPHDHRGLPGCPRDAAPAGGAAAVLPCWDRGAAGRPAGAHPDAFRLGLAVVVVTVSIPVMRANSAVELSIVRVLNPPPEALGWLVGPPVFWLGSAGVIVLLVIVGLLVPRLAAVLLDGAGRRPDLGRVRPAGRAAGLGGRAAADRRAGRAQRRLSGHSAGDHDRRGRHRAALSEPSPAPGRIVPDRPGRAGRGLRRVRASRQRHLQRRARLGCGRGPAPGRGLTAGPAGTGRGHRVDRGPESRRHGRDPGPGPGVGSRAAHRP